MGFTLLANRPGFEWTSATGPMSDFVATTTSDTPIDPQLFAARLLVDGEPSPAFDLDGNGVMPAGWDVLPAGAATPPVEYPLGEALFTEPGDYRLVLRLDVPGHDPLEASQTVVVTS